MSMSAGESWNQVRQAFSDQFEQDGASFVYRRSQWREAFRVTAEERHKFVEDFDQSLRRGIWAICVGATMVLTGVVAFSILKGSDLSQAAMVVGIGLIMIPYFAYYRWAWAAPARELARRTPIAGKRSAEEIRRLRFKNLTYGQMAGVAVGGLFISLGGSTREDLFSGWHRLWLVFGGALILLAAVQAVRKWRFERGAAPEDLISGLSKRDVQDPTQGSTLPAKNPVWRYLPLAVLLTGIAFIAYVPAGQEIAKQPSFWPIVILGCGGWSLFTVVQGLRKGQIQPFVRGFYDSYERETRPKSFWASITWNAAFGCLCLWLAFEANQQASARNVEDRCYDEQRVHLPEDVLSACNTIIGNGNESPEALAVILGARGIAYHKMNDFQHALADYSEAIRLDPKYADPHHNRGLVYMQLGDSRRAVADYTAAIQLDPNLVESYLRRGYALGLGGDWARSIADFDQVIRLNSSRAEAYYLRGAAYRELNMKNEAAANFERAAELDPKMAQWSGSFR